MTLVVALTGSIATGKSEVTKILRRKNYPVFEADKVTHELYETDDIKEFFRSLAPEVLLNNQIDRQKLAQFLLKHPEKLTLIESNIHPRVKLLSDKFIADHRKGKPTLIFLDIPLLFESRQAFFYDKSVLIRADEEKQKIRALTRPGMTEEKLRYILSRQLPTAEKAKRADHILDNSGSLDDLAKNVDDMLLNLEVRDEDHA